MSLSADDVSRLAEIIPADSLPEVLGIIGAAFSGGKDKGKSVRNRRYYAKRKLIKATETTEKATEKATESALKRLNRSPAPSRARVLCGEDSILLEERESKDSPKKNTLQSFRAILSAALSTEMVAEVHAYRRKNKFIETDRAANALVREFIKTGHPNEAAAMMIEKNWRGFEAAWFDRPNRLPNVIKFSARESKLARTEDFREEMRREQAREEREKNGGEETRTNNQAGYAGNTIDLPFTELFGQDSGYPERR